MRSKSEAPAQTSASNYEELERRLVSRTSELTEAVAQLRDTDARLRLLTEVVRNLSMGVVIMDAKFQVTSVNEAYCNIAELSEDEILHRRPPFEADLRRDERAFKAGWKDLKERGAWEAEVWCENQAGDRVALHISITSINDKSGELSQYGAIISDVTQRKEDEERILYQANFDALTGLPNRSLFIDRLGQSLSAMSRAGQKLGLMFIDLDGFKLVNDTMGHDKGDDLLREAATRIAECTRNGDTVARLGGDEFTVIMPNLNDARDAPVVAQRILNSLSKPFVLGEVESFVSGSIGITIYPDDAEGAQDLLKNADAAMYRAKEKGKANYQYFTSDLNTEVTERLRIKNGLSKALELDQFELFYQPKLTLATDRIESVEALMRWESPELGKVSPVRFIPVLEETGMVVEVGEWAIRQACLQHKKWIEAGLPAIRVAVNLSARQLREISFVSVLENVLRETGVGPDGIEIEITESMLMSDTENAVSALNDLHDLGIHVAMDDFGTGYSSLSYLRQFPIDTIKIDRTFVADIASNNEDAEIIRTIINMGQNLNRDIVAEGVETEVQLDMLRDYKCDFIQGYYLSPPVTGDQLVGLLHEKTS